MRMLDNGCRLWDTWPLQIAAHAELVTGGACLQYLHHAARHQESDDQTAQLGGDPSINYKQYISLIFRST
jgi:hypothetical protein